MSKLDLGLPTFDSLFSTEEQRQEAKLEKVVSIPIEEISDFKEHPFHVRLDEDMIKLIESVQENGVLMPALVRPNKDGTGYEMISGHRRKFALTQCNKKEMDVIVRDIDDDQATILMVDSNIQREHILPTERGFAYKMRLDAMKHQGKRIDLTSDQVGPKLKRTNQQLAQEVGDSVNQIKRYIRLTYLIEPLRDMVDGINEDGIEIALNPGYELSFLTNDEQELLVEAIEDLLSTPSLSQAQILKKLSQNGGVDEIKIKEILSTEKPNQKEKISFKEDEINKYFPKSYTQRQKRELIFKLLENWSKKHEREQSR